MNTENKEQSFDKKELSFEEAFARLEEILNQLNSGTVALDKSLKLYEEADHLIAACNKKLTDAERKIEFLIKNRSGELALGNDQKPLTQEFTSSPSPSSNHKSQEKLR